MPFVVREILKSDGCPTPRSGVRAVAQGASPGIDFRDKTSREAAAELQILPPLRGWDVHAHPNPALPRWAMFARRFAAWAPAVGQVCYCPNLGGELLLPLMRRGFHQGLGECVSL